jgi:transcriptional regulator, LacI family
MWCTFTAAKMMNGGRMKLEEIARLAGVSRTTASYVVNGKAEQHRISEKTRERVMAVVNQYNYKPDQAATALRLGSSRLFGLFYLIWKIPVTHA